MKTFGIAGLLVLLGGVGLVPAGAPEKFGFDGELREGVPVPWEVRTVAGTAKFEVVSVPEREGEKCLYLHSVDSSFSLNRETDVDVLPGTEVSWSWKGEKLPSGRNADVRVGTDCDQGLQVLLAFDDGKSIISYVWDTNAPLDTRRTEDYRVFKKWGKLVKVIVVQSGTDGVGKWSTIKRDVFKDFREVFKRDPEKVILIRAQSNSQYTETEAAGYFSPITFTRSE